MFHSDISFSPKEKAQQFAEDARNFLVTYKDAVDFLKEHANNEQAKDHYLETAKNLINNIRLNYVTFSRYLGQKEVKSTVIPTFSKDDERLKMAKLAYFTVKDHFGDLKQYKNFDDLNKKFDGVIDILNKQSNL